MKQKFCLIILFIFCLYSVSSESFSVFQKKGLQGMIKNNRTVVIEPVYDWISINPGYIVCSKHRQTEIYNEGIELLYFVDDWASITKDSEYEIVITESNSGKKLLLDVRTGKMSPYVPLYGQEYGFKENLELVIEKNKRNALYSIVDRKGNVLLTDIEQAHTVYTEGMLAVILENGKSGFVNKKGNFVFETDFYIDPEDIGPRKFPVIPYCFSEKKAIVKDNKGDWYQYDIKGKKTALPKNIQPEYPYYENGLLLIKDKETGKMGYMNSKFQIVIPCKFESAKGFVGNYAVVIFEGKDAIIDKKGNLFFCEELK